MKLIDLHTHSLHSDGAQTPTDVVKTAADAGLSAIALSDHDCIEGVQEAMDAGSRLGVEVIPAVELSAQSDTELHILGYFIDINNKRLQDTMKYALQVRDERQEETCRKLNEQGFDITMEEPTLDDTMPDIERLTWAVSAALGVSNVEISFHVMVKLAKILRENSWKVCVKGDLQGDTFKCMEICPSGDTKIVGCAIDIGTTTVSMVLVDLETGNLLAKGSSGNGQILYTCPIITAGFMLIILRADGLGFVRFLFIFLHLAGGFFTRLDFVLI